MTDFKELIGIVAAGQSLSREQSQSAFDIMMSGDATPSQIGGFLMALRVRGETIDEITGAVATMRDKMLKVDAPEGAIDIVGTGGTQTGTYSISTCSAIVMAGAGATVAKHGNRALSSKTGTADTLERLGVNLETGAQGTANCVREAGVGFMFAPAHHGAMKHAIGPRKDLGMRTLFNILGPLTNPAHVERQVLGVFAPDLCQAIAESLSKLGSKHALVLSSTDGLDEISIAAPTAVWEMRGGVVERFQIDPSDYGHSHKSLLGLEVASAQESADLIKSALSLAPGEGAERARSMIALNAGAAIYVSGVAETLKAGIAAADDVITSGAALDKLDAFVGFTKQLRTEAS